MNFITQYFLHRGIPEDIFILCLSIPIIFAIIILVRRIIGLRTFGLYTPLILVILLKLIGIKNGAIIFLTVFMLMAIMRYFLRKIPLLSMTDIRVLDTLSFLVLILVLLIIISYVPILREVPLDVITFIAIIFMSSYSENLLKIWEVRGFKRFFSPALESLGLIAVLAFIIDWPSAEKIILNYPLEIILASIIIITLLAKWKGLKIREYIKFKDVIKHVELPKKK